MGRLFLDFAGENSLKAVDHMGDVYRDTGEYAEAAVEEIAGEYRDLGRAKQGYEKYRYVFEHWPGADRALWARTGMVMSRIRAWELDAAEAELGSLLGEFSGDGGLAAAVHEIVEEYRNTGAHEEGRELFNYLLSEWAGGDETMLELQVGVALQSIKLRELDKADAAVEKLIADYNDQPNIAKGLFQIAEEHFYAKNYGKAVQLWETVENEYPLSTFPSRPEIPYLVGYCCQRLGQYQKAIRNYKRFADQQPGHKWAQPALYQTIRTYEELESMGAVSTGEAAGEIRRDCQRFLAAYPDSSYSKAVSGISEHWNVIYGWLLSRQEERS